MILCRIPRGKAPQFYALTSRALGEVTTYQVYHADANGHRQPPPIRLCRVWEWRGGVAAIGTNRDDARARALALLYAEPDADPKEPLIERLMRVGGKP